jgi:hypothetical protein
MLGIVLMIESILTADYADSADCFLVVRHLYKIRDLLQVVFIEPIIAFAAPLMNFA